MSGNKCQVSVKFQGILFLKTTSVIKPSKARRLSDKSVPLGGRQLRVQAYKDRLKPKLLVQVCISNLITFEKYMFTDPQKL